MMRLDWHRFPILYAAKAVKMHKMMRRMDLPVTAAVSEAWRASRKC